MLGKPQQYRSPTVLFNDTTDKWRSLLTTPDLIRPDDGLVALICLSNPSGVQAIASLLVGLPPPYYNSQRRYSEHRSITNLPGAIMHTTTVRKVLIFTVLNACGAVAMAQEPADRTVRPSIRVTGEATIAAKPDQAEINIGVVTQALTAQAAAAQNAQKQDAVIAELRKALGDGAEIKTVGYSLSPTYRYPKEGGQPTITGYTASNIVQVKLSNLAQVGTVIDLATQSGANNIQALRFTLKDESAPRTQALGEAAVRARAKSQAIASALGLRIVRVLHVEEGAQVAPPVGGRAFAEMAVAAPTPVEPGTIDVRAIVTLTVEVAQ